MFDGAADQFHQFIAPRTTLPLHLSFPLHASPTPNTFLPFDPYNPSHHHMPLQTNLLHSLHPPSPTHKHQHNKEPNTTVAPILQIQRQLPDLTDSWTNDEVLALLRIRSSMENWFPQLTWEHVSRKLAELGFKKSAEKCKEKFEDESRYFDNINYGKNNYRFLSELEELCQNPDPGGGGGDGAVSETEKTHHHHHQALEENSRDIETTATEPCDGSEKVVVEKSKERKRKRRDRFEMFKGFCESVVNKMMAQQEEIHCKLLEDMVKRDQEKFALEEAWKKQEMDRMNKELEIMAQEQAIAGDRHATIIEFLKKCATTSLSPASQNAKFYKTTNVPNCPRTAILHPQNPKNPSSDDNNLDPAPSPEMIPNHHDQTTLGAENPSTSDTLLQVPSSSNSSPAPHYPSSSSLNSHNNINIIPLESNSVSTYKSTSTTPMVSSENSKEDVGRRWPRDEVLALINLRCTSVSNNNNNNNEEKEGNNKGPLWERISQGMSELGYKRSAKRCKEKWENINKYFRKTKDVNKKRSLNSRTCPYFHQLSCLYGQGKIVPQSEREGNPIVNSGQVPPDRAQGDESSQVGSAGLIQYAC